MIDTRDSLRALRTPTRVLLACGTPQRLRALTAAVRSAIEEPDAIDTVDDLSPTFDVSPYSAIVIDDDVASRNPPASLPWTRSTARPPVVVLLQSTSRAELLPWFEQTVTAHVLHHDNAQQYNDLHVTLRKLVSNDIFGIEKYFAWGARERSFTLQHSSEKERLVSEAEAFAEMLCVPSRMRALVVTAFDEFLSNAFYNAPVDESGRHRFRDRDRTDPVVLGPEEAITVRLCADGRRIGVSVCDPFGSLDPRIIQSTILRGLRRDARTWSHSHGGAGLGFYCAFESLSHLVINIDARKRTEIIGILAMRDSYRDFLGSGKSFNVFARRGPLQRSDEREATL